MPVHDLYSCKCPVCDETRQREVVSRALGRAAISNMDKAVALEARVRLLEGLLREVEGFVGFFAEALDADDEDTHLLARIRRALGEE